MLCVIFKVYVYTCISKKKIMCSKFTIYLSLLIIIRNVIIKGPGWLFFCKVKFTPIQYGTIRKNGNYLAKLSYMFLCFLNYIHQIVGQNSQSKLLNWSVFWIKLVISRMNCDFQYIINKTAKTKKKKLFNYDSK